MNKPSTHTGADAGEQLYLPEPRHQEFLDEYDRLELQELVRDYESLHRSLALAEERVKEAEEVIRHYSDRKSWQCQNHPLCRGGCRQPDKHYQDQYAGRTDNGYDFADAYLARHLVGGEEQEADKI